MIPRLLRLLLVALAAAPASFAQFQIYLVDGNTERAVPALYQLGSFQPGEIATARFRIRNTSTQTATLSLLAVSGSGFALSGAPSLPAGLSPQQAIDFQIMFQATAPGAYSAALNSEGISVLLAATVVPSLTYAVGIQTLGAAPVDFGSVELGSFVSRHFTIENQTAVALGIPAISVTGDGFSMEALPPSGEALQPQQTAGFDVRYQPTAAGSSNGSLVIGGRAFALTGTALAIALPKPSLQVEVPQPPSAQQGTVTVVFDAPARTNGTGSVSLVFQPQIAGAADSSIQFATGGATASFTVAPGDTQASFRFQTGTTAGAIAFTVAMGDTSDKKTITIAPAPVTVTQAQATRAGGTVQVRLTGFDNTRSVSRLTYTFYDAAGNAIAPGSLTVDSAADFMRFFQSSDAGGNFQLDAVFPVTGDGTKIAAFEAEILNTAGTAKTSHVIF